MQTWQRILVPTDFSEYSEQAAILATDLANKYKCELRLVHIIDIQPLTMYGAVPVWSIEEIEPQLQEAAKKSMQEYANKIKGDLTGGLKVTTKISMTNTSIAQAICDDAKEQHADVVIIATHGRTGLNRLLIGSVAEQVVRHAACPVLVVPTR